MTQHLDFDFQVVSCSSSLPEVSQVERWSLAALKDPECSFTLRVVDVEEMTALNEAFRQKAGPTNVLSFPYEAMPGVDLPLLGDVVICAPVIQKEAKEQKKPEEAHWAHMVIHGLLHLQGYDHIEEKDAIEMESEEIRILSTLGYGNPYVSDL